MTVTQKFWAVKLMEKMMEEAQPSSHLETLLAVGELLEELGEDTPPTEAQLREVADKLLAADKTEEMLPSAAQFVEFVLSDAAENGDGAAANDLGTFFYTGRGGTQDYEKAARYYELAAEKGVRQAYENLGYVYYYGRLGEPDYEKAFHCFAKGAFEGNLRSLYKIGDMYRCGYYVKKDEEEAIHIYEYCMRSLSDTAMPEVGADIFMRLADCMWESIGTQQNPELALVLYQQAERLYTERLKNGDFMIRENYKKCIARQTPVRAAIQSQLPKLDWADDAENGNGQ